MRRAVFAIAAFVILTSAAPASAGDPSFGSFVKRLEREYNLRRTRIPFFWLAKGIVRFSSPLSGVSRLDLAIYEDQDLSPLAGAENLQARIHSFLGLGWKPFIEVNSPRSRERVLLYAREKGKSMELFVFVVESDEAVVLLTRVNPEVLSRVIDNPRLIAQIH